MRLRGLGFGLMWPTQTLGFRIQGLGSRAHGCGLGIKGLGFKAVGFNLPRVSRE